MNKKLYFFIAYLFYIAIALICANFIFLFLGLPNKFIIFIDIYFFIFLIFAFIRMYYIKKNFNFKIKKYFKIFYVIFMPLLIIIAIFFKIFSYPFILIMLFFPFIYILLYNPREIANEISEKFKN